MTLRLSIATRLTLIVFSALLAVWIATLAAYYRSQDEDRDGIQPSPAQVLAMSSLLEVVQGRDRELALAALQGDRLALRIEKPGSSFATPEAGAQPGEDRDAYRRVLGARRFAMTVAKTDGPRLPLLRAMNGVAETHVLRIGLATGETLVIEARQAMLVTRMGLPVGFGAGFIGTLIALVALVLMQRATRPLMRLASAFDSMELSGDPLPLPAARTHAPEIQALTKAYNRLQARLSQLVRARMALLGGISHDVRTFATRLRLRVDHIPEGPHRERAIADIAAMIRLLDDALLASRTGAGELAEELVEFDELLRLEVDDRHAAGAPVDLRVLPSASPATVLGDRIALRRISANLIDNAIAYGRAAHLTLAADADSIRLTVDDEGSGIPADLRDLLFEPFVRAESSRNRRTGGAGLGLAIVRSLVEGHGGTISLETAPGGGARCAVTLPRFRA